MAGQLDKQVVIYDQWNGRYLTTEEASGVVWQEYDPNRKDRDGNLLPRYIEGVSK